MTRTNYQDRLDRVTSYIHDNLDGELDFDRIAEVASLSPYHWHRIYHACRGETAVATTRRLRLQRASVSLAQTDDPIAQIATKAGYASPAAFTRAFADAYGLPPATYRERGSHADFRPGQLATQQGGWSIEIQRFDAIPAFAIRHDGPYIEIGKAFGMLFGQLATRGALPERIEMIAVYLDDPTAVPLERLRSFAALAAPGGKDLDPPVERIEIAGGDYAVLRHKGPYADMSAAYNWLFGTWLPQSDREADDRPVVEKYLNSPQDTKPSDLLTDLCLPLRSIAPSPD